ncbi:hypothetical protein [Streptomyces neyagawaensis]|uniref:hypothetical protein n=1 Tax=Streptomyces neyagawaensis TaxID=42238 RepID=UPI0006E2361B
MRPISTGSPWTGHPLLGQHADGRRGLDLGATLPAARISQITRRYTGAFFDLHLRHRPQPLLDQPSPQYPEVGFCSTATPSRCTSGM